MNIIRKPSWFPGRDNATTIGTIIYMPEWYHDPSRDQREKDALLLHEQKHVEQFQRGGWIGHSWRTMTDRAYRKQCELAAYEVQIRYLATHSYKVVPERWAGLMSDSPGNAGKWIEFGEALEFVRKWVEK
jgi:hypothetical protein